MKLPTWRPHHVIAALLVVSAVLFLIGVTTEPDEDTHTDEPPSETATHSEGNEATEAQEAGEAAEHNELAAETDEGEERILGIDVESPVMIAIALLGSLLLAVLVWRRPAKRLLAAIAVAAGAFVVLDAAEVIHQLDEDRTGLAALAALVTALHAAAAALAIHQAIGRPEMRERRPWRVSTW